MTSEQLGRLLFIIPTAARADGAIIAELASALDVSAEVVIKDLAEATAREYYQTGGHVDPISIFVEGDRVFVHAPEDFQRPVRLSRGEGLALGLGLRNLAAEDSDQYDEILALAERLERELCVETAELQPRIKREREPEPEMTPELFELSFGEDDVRGTVGEAIAQARLCRIMYLKPGASAAERDIQPMRLVYAHGRWYVTAIAAGVDAPHVFRLDRIMAIDLGDVAGEKPADVRMDGAFIARDDAKRVAVRYSSRIAPWIVEQRPDAEKLDDGSVRVTHDVADHEWLVRHVLQYGGEASVEDGGMRKLVADAARRIASV